MTAMLCLLGAVSALELALYLPYMWPHRRAYSISVLVALSLTTGAVLAAKPTLATILLTFVGLYRLLNLMRVAQNKMHAKYLYSVALRTSLWLIGYQLLVLALWWASNTYDISAHGWRLAIAMVQLVAATIVLGSTMRNLRTTKPLQTDKHFSDNELPSISVCIPARNETQSLEECLRSLVASDYPKLEILVLDDQSHDRTPEIIRGFAHDGVRFVKGTHAPKTWTAKNWAYEQLQQEANGEWLVFSGVDTRFDPASLRELVTTMLVRKKSMMSIIPQNKLNRGLWQKRSLLLQPARYAWELSLPRRLFLRPPILSSCWIVDKSLLTKAGGFAAVERSILPEIYFAKAAIQKDGYTFVQASVEAPVVSDKRAEEQWDTAVRTRYPQLHRRPEMVFLATVLEIGLLVGPIVLIISSVGTHEVLVRILAIVSLIANLIAYGLIVDVTYRRRLFGGALALPFAVLLNAYVRHESMWRYEFAEVTWKGRDVSFPVMHVIAHLPSIDKS